MLSRGPRPRFGPGPPAVLDVSDGLGRDAGRLARASGVGIELDDVQLAGDVAPLQQVVGADDAWRSVVEGGEEHSLLACFPEAAGLPDGWRKVGQVVAGSGAAARPSRCAGRGWDHFGAEALRRGRGAQEEPGISGG